jgi:arabinofuranan 3-O-arabinosyltransferase
VSDRAVSLRGVIAGLIGLCVLVVFARSWGVLAADAHFVFFWDPAAEFGRYGSIWTRNTDLGGVLTSFAPVPYAILAALRWVGFEPWFAQRIWYTLLLSAAAVGTAVFTHALRPTSRIAPAVAGLATIVSPFTVGYFLPSWLYVNAAVLPWLAYFVHRGLTGDRPWRWAAAICLAGTFGSAWNPPAAVLAAGALLPLVLYAVASGRSTRTDVWALAWRVAALAAAIVPVVLLRLGLAAATLEKNLASTESAVAVSRSSSWSESLRGLGSWRLYWGPAGELLFAFVEPLLTNPAVVLASFSWILLAVATLVWGRGGARLMLMSMLLMSAMFMVGGFPPSAQSPLGRLLFAAYDVSATAFSFRSMYKMGAGLVLATSVLVGLGVAAWWDRHPRRQVRVVTASGIAVLAVLSAAPWFQGTLFAGNKSLRGEIPAYWIEAARWLDDAPDEGAALVVPRTETLEYRWGAAPNGDIFPSIVDRPVMSYRPLSLTPELQASTIQSVINSVSTGRYEVGTVGPIASRLGVRFVVVRNDLVWETAGVARPAELDALRNDPDLRLVASFGEPGENTVPDEDSDDPASEAEQQILDGEADLAPVEIYEVVDAPGPVRATTDAPRVLVSGDGNGWSVLARQGELDGTGPIEYTATMDAVALRDAVDAGSPVAITDSNRRRTQAWGVRQETLAESDDNRALDLFEVPGSQTSIAFGEGATIEEVGPPRTFRPSLAHRPAAAFDGDAETSWLTGVNTVSADDGLRIAFSAPTEVRSLSVTVADEVDGRDVRSVRLFVDDVEQVEIDVFDGVAAVRLGPKVVSSVMLVVGRVSGSGGGPYGFSEVVIDDLDLAERVVVPTDVARAARSDPALTEALTEARVLYAFERVRSVSGDPEAAINRRFEVVGDRSTGLRGMIGFDTGTSDVAIGRFLGAPMRVSTSSRLGGDPAVSGIAAIDGDPTTAWIPDAESVVTLGLSQYPDEPAGLTLVMRSDASLPRWVTVDGADGTFSRRVRTDECVPRTDELCTIELDVERLDLTRDLSLSLVVDEDAGPVEVVEVELDGRPNPAIAPIEGCREDLVSLDGRAVPVRLEGSTDDLLELESVPFTGCETIELAHGVHDLTTAVYSSVNDLVLDTGGPPVPAEPVPVDAQRRGTTRYTVGLPDDHETVVVLLGQAQVPQWQATAGDEDLGQPLLLDGQAAWVVPAGTSGDVEITFGAQARYRWLLMLSVLGHAAALVLLVVAPRRRRRAVLSPTDQASRRRDLRRRSGVIAMACVPILALMIGGPLQFLIVLGLVVAMRRHWITPFSLGVVSFVLLVVSVAFVLPPFGPALGDVDPFWPGRRSVAHDAALQSAVILWAAIAGWIARGDDERWSPLVDDTSDDPTVGADGDGDGDDVGGEVAGAVAEWAPLFSWDDESPVRESRPTR